MATATCSANCLVITISIHKVLTLIAGITIPAQAEVEIASPFTVLPRKASSDTVWFEVQVSALRQLKSLEEPVSLKSIPIPGGTVDLSLRPFNPFADDAKVVSKDGSGETPVPLPDSAYFLGESSDAGSVFLRVSAAGDMYGSLSGGDNPPVRLVTRGKEGFATLKKPDTEDGHCAVEDALPVLGKRGMGVKRGTAKDALTEFKILVDVEYRLMRNTFSGDEARAIAYTADLAGELNAIYQGQTGISFRVSELILWAEPPSFERPIVSDTSPTIYDMLGYYRSYHRTRQNASNHFAILLGMKQRSYGSALGVASIGGMCGESAGMVAVRGDATKFDPAVWERDPATLAHEIGHLFGCEHVESNTLMNATNIARPDVFDPESIEVIQDTAQSTSGCKEITKAYCSEEALYGQRPIALDPGDGLAMISEQDAQVKVYDDFSGAGEAIGGVRWWALPNGCSRSPERYRITFHESEGLLPREDALTTFYVTPEVKELEIPLGGRMLVEYEVRLPRPVYLGAGWVSVQGVDNTVCDFAWARSLDGNGYSAVRAGNGAIENSALEPAFCLMNYVDLEPTDGAVCPPGSLLAQPPRLRELAFDTTPFASNEDGDRFFVRYTGLEAPITRIDWWGKEWKTGDLCNLDGGRFAITFYPFGLSLDSPIVSYRIAPDREALETYDTKPYYHYTYQLPEPLDLPMALMVIEGIEDSVCRFSWGLSDSSNSEAGADWLSGSPNLFLSGAFAICLSGVPGPSDLENACIQFGETDTNADGMLSPEELAETLPEIDDAQFEKVDLNGDGELSVSELLEATRSGLIHSADSDGDRVVRLDELLRVVQLFNAGGYACAPNAGTTEDGYLPRAPLAGDPECTLHATDTNNDHGISLSELLRAIQIFNLGGYQRCEGASEDGFCAAGI